MNDLQLTYSPYSLKFKIPFLTAKTEIKERKGFILRLSDSSGFEGIGDASPFAEFGSESLSDVENTLSDFTLKIKIDESDIENSLSNTLKEFSKLPALRHGLEQAILNLLCRKKNTTIDKLLNLKLNKQVKINAAIGLLNPEESVKKVESFIEEGYNTIKVKAGREIFDDDLSVIKSIREAVGENIKLRIDPNGKWKVDEAIKNLNKLKEYNIEYAEQPVNDLKDYIKLSNETSISLAPDESIRSISDANEFINSGAISYLIIKPMLLGGLVPTLEIIKLAKSNNIIPVITSSFESAVGKAYIVIAAASIDTDVAHGIGITKYYEKDVMKDPFPIKSGKIILN
jgi:o-succinylbenzoate synthase